MIIPPNIHDPLHLLDPVDAFEYQKQLSSPIKKRRKTKNRNRNKKKKFNFNNFLELNEINDGKLSDDQKSIEHISQNATANTSTTSHSLNSSASSTTGSVLDNSLPNDELNTKTEKGFTLNSLPSIVIDQKEENDVIPLQTPLPVVTGSDGDVDKKDVQTEREKAVQNLKLELNEQGGRKRRISESFNGKTKVSFI